MEWAEAAKIIPPTNESLAGRAHRTGLRSAESLNTPAETIESERWNHDYCESTALKQMGTSRRSHEGTGL
jgi:hypothetical protein